MTLTVLLFRIFFSDTIICLGNFDHVTVSVSIDFLANSKLNALFHGIDYDYSHADWDGLCDYLRDVTLEDIFKLSF